MELTGFWLGKYPVAQSQWDAVMERNPSAFKGPDLPVERVTCDDTGKFIQSLNHKAGRERFSLPVGSGIFALATMKTVFRPDMGL